MTLSTYQFSFNGFTFGAGTPYTVEKIDGLMATAGIRNQDDNRGYIDGTYSGRDFYDSRTVTIDFLLVGDSSHPAQYYFQQLQKNLAPQVYGYYPDPYASTQASSVLGLFQFQLTATTGQQRMWGRVRSVSASVDPEFTYGYILATADLHFPDPRYYDETANTASGSTATIYNNGWATTSPAITIASPSASGTITDSVTGAVMTFANVNTSYSLIIDTLQRTISQNGISARNTLTTMTNWLTIPANTSTGTWTSTLGSMAVTWRNAYV
jgi:hypothetical protein